MKIWEEILKWPETQIESQTIGLDEISEGQYVERVDTGPGISPGHANILRSHKKGGVCGRKEEEESRKGEGSS